MADFVVRVTCRMNLAHSIASTPRICELFLKVFFE